jgi:hypothetical protein
MSDLALEANRDNVLIYQEGSGYQEFNGQISPMVSVGL